MVFCAIRSHDFMCGGIGSFKCRSSLRQDKGVRSCPTSTVSAVSGEWGTRYIRGPWLKPPRKLSQHWRRTWPRGCFQGRSSPPRARVFKCKRHTTARLSLALCFVWLDSSLFWGRKGGVGIKSLSCRPSPQGHVIIGRKQQITSTHSA